uniref:Peptidase M13 domain containing protein n=1 Tax=Haemonchus contortus TaxID=6289 RepID=A0A7I5E7V7_HAECO
MRISVMLVSLFTLISCETDSTGGRSQNKDVSTACNDFYRYACSPEKSKTAPELALDEFNKMLDEEAELISANLTQVFVDLETKLPTLERKSFRTQLVKMCGNDNFIENYLRAAIEEIGEASPVGQQGCSDMVNTAVEIVFDDERESVESLVDVIKKVRDIIAFENIRKKDPRINEAFQLTRDFFINIRHEYLEFINSTTSDRPEDRVEWYTRAAGVELELLMRTQKFFVAEHLEIVAREYLNCTRSWIMGVDNREKAFCLYRAWRIATGTIPMPTRLAQFLHDLRSLNVSAVNDRVYVRPAYALFLLNTTEEALQFATLGVEIAREITRASFDVPLETGRCLQEQMNEHKCEKDLIANFVRNYREFSVFTLSVSRSSNATSSSSISTPDHASVSKTDPNHDDCHTIESDLVYNIVALRALFPALERSQGGNQEKLRSFYSRSSFLNCDDKKPLTVFQLNAAFAQSENFQRVFGCNETDSMGLPQVSVLYSYNCITEFVNIRTSVLIARETSTGH